MMTLNELYNIQCDIKYQISKAHDKIDGLARLLDSINDVVSDLTGELSDMIKEANNGQKIRAD